MKKLINVIGGIGFTFFLLGVSGMDSESVLAPVAMASVGMIIFLLSTRLDEEFYTEK